MFKTIFALIFAAQAFAMHVENPVRFSDEGIVFRTQLALNEKGTAVVAWLSHREEENNAFCVADNSGSEGNQWAYPHILSLGKNYVWQYFCHVDKPGNVSVVWRDDLFERSLLILSAKKSIGGNWTLPVDLKIPTKYPQLEDIVFNPNGEMISLFIEQEKKTHFWDIWSKPNLLEIISLPYNSEKLPTLIHKTFAKSYFQRITYNPEGDAFCFWHSNENSELGEFFGSWKKGTSDWTSPQKICNLGAFPLQCVSAYNRNHDTSLAWGTMGSIIEAAVYSKDHWSEVATFSALDGGTCWHPKIAMDSEGNVMLIWTEEIKQRYHLMSAYKPVGEPWTLATEISGSEESAFNPSIACDEEGCFFIVWQENSSVNRTSNIRGIQFSTQERRFTEKEIISPKNIWCAGPSIAIKGNQKKISWVQFEGNDCSVQVADLE